MGHPRAKGTDDMAEQQPGYSERDDRPTAAQTGGDPEELEGAERGRGGAPAGGDGGGRAHTTPEEGHPAGKGPRSDRDVGGPTAA
jgi:hypothetical protein